MIRLLSNVKEDKLLTLVNLADEVNNLVNNDHLKNPFLLEELLDKLPVSYKMKLSVS